MMTEIGEIEMLETLRRRLERLQLASIAQNATLRDLASMLREPVPAESPDFEKNTAKSGHSK